MVQLLLIKRIINQFRFIPYVVRYIFENPFYLYKFPLYLFIKTIKGSYCSSPKGFQGYKLMLDPNSGIDRTLFFRGGAYENYLSFLKKHLNNDSIFFDLGAHSGFFSIFASTIIKNGEIHAFEPVHHLCNNIRRSIKLNKIKNIKINQKCVGARDGKTEFYLSTQLDASSIRVTQLQARNRVIKCSLITLGTYCKVNKLRRLDILKIDVEGSEKDILFSAKKILKRFNPIIILEFSNHTAEVFGFHPNELYDYLSNLGYKMYSMNNTRLLYQKRKEFYLEDLFCIPT